MRRLTRRDLMIAGAAGAVAPTVARAAAPQEITWDMLIPPGVPYSEIVGQGDIDFANDTWKPIFDENATKLNDALDGAYIRMPGYIIPIELDAKGVTEFILVPYVGACIHVPPPPANQLVYATTEAPWPSDQLWDAVWVTGFMYTRMFSTELAEIGYALEVNSMEGYSW